MSSVSATAVAASTEALNKVMASAQAKTMDQAEKLMKVTVEAAVGKESGKGTGVDCCA